MAIRRLETRPAVAEIHLARDAGADHPLQRAVDGGAADARVLVADEIAQIVRAQMALLADEDTENSIALAWTACRRQAAGSKCREGDGPSLELVSWGAGDLAVG